MSHRIAHVSAREILDSRGRPTLEVAVGLASGASGVAGVPSGASTGSGEAVERRDGDPSRFGGAGVLAACRSVGAEIAGRLVGGTWSSIRTVDDALVALDGTPTKRRLGANAIVGVSMAVARAMASADGVALYRWLDPAEPPRLPAPHFNVLNGGAHAQNRLELQEFMVAPLGAPSFSEALRAGAEVYRALRTLLHERSLGTGLGDEGGFAPEVAGPEDALDLLVEAIGAAGYTAGRDGVAIALDPAASELVEADGRYRYRRDERLTSAELIARYEELVGRYPIWSIEDGMAEGDYRWRALTRRLGDRVQLVGDDNFVTDPARIRDAVADGIANAALLKVNQIGTVTETLHAVEACRRAGYGQMVSHRSGETTDAFIADLAVAIGCGQLKSGAPARGERVAKYNRLLQIEAECPDAPYGLGDGP